MPAVADVVRQHAPAYLARFGEAVPRAHRRVLGAISDCRTGRLGTVVFAYKDCGQRHRTARSCGNRHCPGCQHDKGTAWLNRQTGRVLPCPCFLLTFTLPAELRALARARPRTAHDAFVRATSEAIKVFAADPKYIGTPSPGFFGVLHTWGRQLPYHPHLHYVMAGGGPSADGEHWLPARADFLMPAKQLSRLFRGKFRHAVKQADLLQAIDSAAWKKDWVVDIQAVGDGRTAIRYLAPYIFRVAISDRRILASDDDHVTFTWRKSGSRRARSLRLEAHESCGASSSTSCRVASRRSATTAS
jgi:hypothetical protein